MTAEEILAALQAIIDGAKTDGDRDLTEEESERCEQLRAEYATAQERERRSADHKSFAADLKRVSFRGQSSGRRADGASDEEIEFRSAFMSGKLMDLAEFRAQSSTTTAGGYSIPAGFREKLVERQKAFGGIVQIAETLTTDDWVDMPFPTVDDTSNTAEIVAENSAPASAGADIVLGTKTLKAFRLVASGTGNTWLKVPIQLMDSSYLDWENFVTRKLGERLGRKEAAYAATGAGTTEPEGIVTGLTSSFEIASNTAGISYAELIRAETTVDPAYRDMGNCKWVMHDSIWALVRQIVDENGRPVILEQAVSGISNGVQRSLLGYPVVIDNSLPSTWGDQVKTLVFGDIREAFVVRRVRNPQFVSDPLQFFLNGQVGFLAASGFGSLVQNPNAATVVSGHND